jgi:hypothetical protein
MSSACGARKAGEGKRRNIIFFSLTFWEKNELLAWKQNKYLPKRNNSDGKVYIYRDFARFVVLVLLLCYISHI